MGDKIEDEVSEQSGKVKSKRTIRSACQGYYRSIKSLPITDEHGEGNESEPPAEGGEGLGDGERTIVGGEYDLLCDKCGERYHTRAYLDRHIRTEHSGKVKCSECDETIAVDDINRHIREQHQSSSDELVAHYTKSHPDTPVPTITPGGTPRVTPAGTPPPQRDNAPIYQKMLPFDEALFRALNSLDSTSEWRLFEIHKTESGWEEFRQSHAMSDKTFVDILRFVTNQMASWLSEGSLVSVAR
eukprot:GHVN01078606.1.p1 GENE.GHVN01078606.1~~GHVN01078606.1.p1  ORF type:complete len:243 (-),score=53.80 GHVN01078606.1:1267-1995(-)